MGEAQSSYLRPIGEKRDIEGGRSKKKKEDIIPEAD